MREPATEKNGSINSPLGLQGIQRGTEIRTHMWKGSPWVKLKSL